MNILRGAQNIFLGTSLFVLAYLPLYSAFGEDSNSVKGFLYFVSFLSVTFVMSIRPLADIFSDQKWLRSLVFLRKGLGVFSASIIVGYMFGNVIDPNISYLTKLFSTSYWSLQNCALFARLGDFTGLLLLLTSNNLSIATLKGNWKLIQRLSYVYFYSGGIYEVCVFESMFAYYAMIGVTCITVFAFFLKFLRKRFR